ncbi:hypothetical protein [Pseudoalteromonas marina]|uniref:Uncharacterized protein n=1 Tax=Pseudoalteromonas marina TaxID=267375 RepID=A0ABT9FI71_9GAMM|nr:hypothetical protein [Pseudoalteromonas marina]MDP2566433.1 hypothetical protein [Pseudoalteromonas marina]
MANSITIDYEYDDDGNEIDESYVVALTGLPADEFGISEDYFTSDIDAHEFAKEVSLETDTKITWLCMRPGWA